MFYHLKGYTQKNHTETKTQNDTDKLIQHCPCFSKAVNKSSKPRAGVTAIIEGAFLEDMAICESERMLQLTKKDEKKIKTWTERKCNLS